MAHALRIVDESCDFEQEEVIRKYYFTFEETMDLLKCKRFELYKVLKRVYVGQVYQNKIYMIPPDQIQVLREVIYK